MRETHKRLPPLDVIEVYKAEKTPKAMWGPLGSRTVDCLAEDARHLAMLWESAWREGGGSRIAAAKLVAVPQKTLIELYNDKSISKAMWLDEMVQAGIGVEGPEPEP